MYESSDDSQQLNYKVNVDRSDVYQAINDIEQRAQQSAQSVSAMSSNILNQIAQLQAGAMFQPPMTPMNQMGQLNAMQAAMYAGSTMPFSPQSMMAQDMYQRQVAAMGPSSGFGPSMTTPAGTPTINPFLTPAAPSYTLPTGPIQQMGGPGQPGEPPRSRLFFGTGEGSLTDLAFRSASAGLRSFMFGGRAGVGFSNDNLEDPMHRAAEREAQYLSENLYNVGAGVTGFIGSLAAGGAVGSAGTAFAKAMKFGKLASAGMTLGTGVIGSMVFDSAIEFAASRNRPYQEAAEDLRDYLSPYVRGSAAGGGISYRDTLRLQRDIAQTVSKDNFFNAGDYRTLINMAGDTGMFQMVGSKDQAMKAIENMSKSVKTLYALGVKSREQLQVIDSALNQFGVSAAADPTRFANLMQTFASSALSAGMSTGQLTQAVAPIAQAGMAQGLGPAAGAVMGAQNLGIAGTMFRQGTLGAFDNAYFGGTAGFGNTLSSAQLSMLRSPYGQAMMAGMFAPGSGTLGSVLGFQGVDPMQALLSVNGYANNPLRFAGITARMPELTQHMGSYLQFQSMQGAISAFEQLGLPRDAEGKINPTDLVGFLTKAFNMPANEALALVKALQNAPETAQGLQQDVRQQRSNIVMESSRRMSMSRYVEKKMEHIFDEPIVNLNTDSREFAADVADSLASMIGGLLGRRVKDMQELQTGVRNYRLNQEDMPYLTVEGAQAKKNTAANFAQRLGIFMRQAQPDESATAPLKAEEIEAILNDNGQRTEVLAALRRAGVDVTEQGLKTYLQGLRISGAAKDEASDNSALYRRSRDNAVGSGLGAPAQRAVEQAALNVIKAAQSRDSDVLSSYVQAADAGDDSNLRFITSDSNTSQAFAAADAAAKSTAGGNEVAQHEAINRALVAGHKSLFGGKSYKEIMQDPDPTLRNRLGQLRAAYDKSRTGGPQLRDLADKSSTGGAGRDLEAANKRLEELLDDPNAPMSIGVAATTIAGLTLTGAVVGAMAGPGGVFAGTGYGFAAGLLAVLGGDTATPGIDASRRFRELLKGDKAKADVVLQAGIAASLRQLIENNNVGSYRDLLKLVQDRGGLRPSEARELLQSAGFTEGGDFMEQAAALKKSDDELTGRALQENDTVLNNYVADARSEHMDRYLGKAYKARQSIATISSNKYQVSDTQAGVLTARFGAEVAGQFIRDLSGGNRQAAKRAVTDLAKGSAGQLSQADRDSLGALAALFDKVDPKSTLDDDDKSKLKALGLSSFEGAKSSGERFRLLSGRAVELMGGSVSTEQGTTIAGTTQVQQMINAQSAALKTQEEFFTKFSELANKLGKDTDGTLAKTLADAIGSDTSKTGLYAVVKKFDTAADKFAAAVNASSGSGTRTFPTPNMPSPRPS